MVYSDVYDNKKALIPVKSRLAMMYSDVYFIQVVPRVRLELKS